MDIVSGASCGDGSDSAESESYSCSTDASVNKGKHPECSMTSVLIY